MTSVFRSIFYGRGCQIVFCYFLLVAMTSCSSGKKQYISNCDGEQTFVKVNFTNLLDSISFYDQKYVETTGVYRVGKEKSALYNDSTLTKPDDKALWVNFSQDCELYLKNTRVGFFEYNTSSAKQYDNIKVRIRGKIDVHNRGHLKLYKGCIDRISFVEM